MLPKSSHFDCNPCYPTPHLDTLVGTDLLTNKEITTSAEGKKGLVIVFLSSTCPCSNSHIAELKDLSEKYPDFKFVGIHSNVDEELETTKSYFKQVGLPFYIIQDKNTQLADRFRASKTPHSYIVLSSGQIAYQGGVSNSQNFESSDRKYLREALEDLQAGKKVRTPEGRTLGCVISREDNNVW